MSDRRQIGIKLRVDLLDRIDRARASQTRTAFIEAACEARLNGGPGPAAQVGKPAAGENATPNGEGPDTPAPKEGVSPVVARLLAEQRAK